ncbi:condensation domain-containing protein [Nostoc sp. 106C]|uniref:condensation domain-containing protein n=1 Tax=Nostoc sp. 106C TaxID=1932667 RepID=UPI000B67D7A4|nr:condensation domain-containing protein [Nostoc sp. 106C]OUL26109.1 hypothetical protein BV375_21965 [Nostoc sp. 106C]
MVQPFNDLKDIAYSCTTLVEILQYRSQYQPNTEAFSFLQDGENTVITLTYQELDRRSRAIASQLQSMGMAGERALLLYPPGLDFLASFFGCLYAGVVAVPAYPPHNQRNTPRIQTIIADAQAAIALTTSTLLPKVQSLIGENYRFHWLATDSLEPGIETAWQAPFINQDSLVFLQYTSGSTGTPKGVMLSHSNLLHNAAVTYKFMEHSPQSKFVSWLPVYHDMGLIGGILQPLYGGFPCILMSPAAFLQRPYRWLQAISHHQGTTSGAPNFAYELCIDKITPEQRATLNLSSWSVAFNGAEPIRHNTLERFAATFAECGFRPEAFYPCYGMAEATLMVSGVTKTSIPRSKTVDKIALSQNQIRESITNQDSQTFVSCGYSIPEQQIVIAHPENCTRCQPDEVGEIWISSASVGKGYWHRTLETEQTFQAYLTDTTEGPFLRTGDLGFLDHGEVFITGRAKDLIIIRGRNLYPQDIELTAERSHPSLRLGSCAAFAVEVDNEERLVVVQELEFRAKPNYEEVISNIRQAVAEEYEIQVYAVVLIKPGTICKTSSGKIQRRATKAAFLANNLDIVVSNIRTSATVGAKVFTAPRNLVEEMLATIWAEVLKWKQVGIDDNFFELGGDSLIATQLISRIRDTFQVDISLLSLFEFPTIASFSDRLQKIQQTQLSLPLQPLAVASRPTEIPLSFAQARLWFLDQLEPGNYAYNIPVALQLTGHLNISALEQSFNEIVRRHEALRTTFVMGSHEPIQIITPQQTITISLVDLRDLADSEQQAQVQHLALEEAKRPFNLGTGPLIRVTLLQLNNTKNVLLLTMHHIIADGWSMGVLVKELATFYEGFVSGKQPQMPKLPIQYADFAIWQREWLQTEGLETQLAYWKEQLNGAPASLNLPIDRARPSIQTFQGISTSFTLSSELSQALKTLSRQQGVTLFMTLLATFQTLLNKYTNQDDIVVGTDVANRNRSELEPMIGFFINLLVLRTNFSGNPTFRELLQQVREVALGAYAHQDLPFAKLVESLRPERNLSHTPLFQVLFVLQNSPMPALEFSGLKLSNLKFDTGTTKFDLGLFIEETEQGLIGTWQYSTDLFNSSTITRMTGHFETLLNNIVNQPDTRINSLEILTKTEKENLDEAQKQRQETKFKKFKTIKPKAVSLSPAELVKTYLLDSDERLPLVIEPVNEDVELAAWATTNREFIENKLLQHGGILFRNFPVNSATEFENFAQSICLELFGDYGDLPRAAVGGKVYGSTPYPADKAILFHNESSHLQTWPLKIWFFCVQPAQQGGETPIVDCRKIYQQLNPQLRERFEQKQLMYVRNFIEGLDVSWQQFFRTTDKAVVENYSHQSGIDWEWLPDNNLRTRSYRQAITKHPRTQEMVFFNQIQLHHISFLEPSVQKSLLSLFGEEKLPRNVYYGDGSPIEQSIIEEITEIYQQSQVSFPWQQGDIVMLDNMLTAHSRNPYVGSRKILVAMGDMYKPLA